MRRRGRNLTGALTDTRDNGREMRFAIGCAALLAVAVVALPGGGAAGSKPTLRPLGSRRRSRRRIRGSSRRAAGARSGRAGTGSAFRTSTPRASTTPTCGRLPARAGSALPDGPEPPPGERHTGGAARSESARLRRPAANARPATGGGAIADAISPERAPERLRWRQGSAGRQSAAIGVRGARAAKARARGRRSTRWRSPSSAFGLSSTATNRPDSADRLPGGRRGAGFKGTALFTEDVMRSEPFAHAPRSSPARLRRHSSQSAGPRLPHPRLLTAASTRPSRPWEVQGRRLPTEPTGQGSNIWVVGGQKSATGRPMVASDPHLALGSPPTFYEVGIGSDSDSDALTSTASPFPARPRWCTVPTATSPGARR